MPNNPIAWQQTDLQMGKKLLVSLLFFVHSPAAKLTYVINSKILLFGAMTDSCYEAGGGINTSDVRFDTTNTHNNQPFHSLKFLVSLLFFILSPTAKLTYTVNNFFSKSLHHPPQAPIPNSSQRVGQIVAVIFAPSIERIGLTPPRCLVESICFKGGPVVPFSFVYIV